MTTRAARFHGVRIVLGVSGSIAAYKAVSLLRRLTEEGAQVRVIMTAAATRFVTPLTFEVLSHHPVAFDLFAAREDMLHLSLPQWASAVLVAPATANQLAKYAVGLSDDLLSTTVLAAPCPIMVAPAMDGDMWDHPAVRTNLDTLRHRGVVIVDPEEGPLASGQMGKGRLASEEVILSALEVALSRVHDWRGERVLVSAGPTQEPVDAVRYLSNRSSGKMGYAIAEAARDRGAEVVLVSGPTHLTPPSGVECVAVTTAESMAKALHARLLWSTVVIMAAAVGDFRVANPAPSKRKKTEAGWQHLQLEPTEDILAALAQRRTSQCLVGFAAETERLIDHAQDKLTRKNVDLIVANDVSQPGSGFGSDTSAAVLIDRRGRITPIPTVPKRALADRILDAIQTLKAGAVPERAPSQTPPPAL